MKPLLLKISAFGSFANEVTIDFSIFQNSLFLIAGKTGAGKTTIFDAFLYALYGETTQKERDASSMRSDFANPATRTFVELTFMQNGKEYVVRREPKYIRERVRGSGLKENKSSAELHLPDGTIQSNIGEVTKKITEIIGLDAAQFKQTSLLPQGDFKQLLSSDANTKERIFRKLFSTEKILNFQIELKDRAKKYKDEILLLETELRTIVANFQIDDQVKSDSLVVAIQHVQAGEMSLFSKLETEMFQYIESIKNKNDNLATKIITSENQLQQFDKEIEQARVLHELFMTSNTVKQKLDELLQQREENEQKNQTVHLKKQVLFHVANHFQHWQNLKNEIRRVEEELSKQNHQFAENEKRISELSQIKESWDARSDELDAAKIKLMQLEQQLEEYEAVERKKKEHQQLLDNRLSKTKQKEKNQQDLSKIEEGIKSLGNQIEELKDAEKDFYVEENQLNIAQNQYEKSSDIVDVWRNLLEESDKLESLTIKIQDLQSEVQKRNEEYQQLEQQFTAAHLAITLKEGKPCPVCGQTHHPNPAKMPDVLEESLKTQAENLEELNNELHDLLLTQATASHDVGTKQDRIQRFLLESSDANLNKIHSLEQKNYTYLKEKIDAEFSTIQLRKKHQNEIRHSLEQLASLNEQYESLVEQQAVYADKMKTITEEIEGESSLLQTLEIEIQQFAKHSFYESYQDAKEAFDSQNNEYQKNISERKRSMQTYEDSEKNKIRLQTQLEQSQKYAKEMADKESLLATNVLAQCQKLNLSINQINQYIDTAENIEQEEKEVQAYFSSITDLQNKLEEVEMQINHREQPILNDLQSKRQEMNAKIQNDREQLTQLKYILQTNQNIYEKSRQMNGTYQDKQNKYQKLNKLSALANGQIGQKKTFEAFVQSYYFDRMLVACNQRLKIMTNHRYFLDRGSENQNNRKRSGLDFRVFDSYTGKYRSSATLSGGEGFLTSLALALGLSDTVQNLDSGIIIETLFIDEGFGTLDRESLELSIRGLETLSNRQHMVGIISHIEEWRERIRKQILVENQEDGSKITIIDE